MIAPGSASRLGEPPALRPEGVETGPVRRCREEREGDRAGSCGGGH